MILSRGADQIVWMHWLICAFVFRMPHSDFLATRYNLFIEKLHILSLKSLIYVIILKVVIKYNVLKFFKLTKSVPTS